MQAYKTVKGESEITHIQTKSRFIGSCFPVDTEAAAANYIEGVKKRYYDARHHCFAYALRSGAMRYGDDGEPQGTAGLPMLDILNKSGIRDALVVVTRYFGGTLLGTGGLVRAYGTACQAAVEAAGIITMLPSKTVSIELDYAQFQPLERFLRSSSYEVNIEYSEKLKIGCAVSADEAEEFAGALIEKCGGKASPLVAQEIRYFEER